MLNSLVTHTTATGNIPEAPELHLAIYIVQSYLVKVAPVVSSVRAKSVFVLRYSHNLSAVGCAQVKLSYLKFDSCCAYCSGEIHVRGYLSVASVYR